jgi:Zn-dependent protease
MPLVPSVAISQSPAFRILGFPVSIAPGFIFGLLLLAGLNAQDPAFALRLVVAIAVFTLVHELGHALAARRFGADSTISLSFLVGWASFRPSRPLGRLDRVAITAAGPLVQIVLGTAILLALGTAPWSYDDVRADALLLAVWWAGPILGLANLLPLVPMDGGNIVATGLDAVVPGRGYRLVQWWTMAVTAAALAAVVVSPTWRPWALTVALFAFWNWRTFTADRQRTPAAQDAARRNLVVAQAAERAAWTTGRPGLFPPPYGPSPWYRAHVLHEAGKDATARGLLLEALEHGGGAWVPPAGAPSEQLVPLVELLPDPLPVGDLHAGIVLQKALLDTGYLRRSADYGARLYQVHSHPAVAQLVAQALALLGHEQTAEGWRRAAGSEPGRGDG